MIIERSDGDGNVAIHNADTTGGSMLGIYYLEDGIPTDPEIVLAGNKDPDMFGQMLRVFESNEHIRFFLINGENENSFELGTDLHFVKDNSDWVLAAGNDFVEVIFDDSSFNQAGNHGSFDIVHSDDGSISLRINEPNDISEDTDSRPPEESPAPLLIDDTNDNAIFAHVEESESSPSTIYIAPSALTENNSEYIVNNFNAGDTLELEEGLTIDNIIWNDSDEEVDYTQILVSDDVGNHIVVKLMGVSQTDLSEHMTDVDAGTTADDLIQLMIDSGHEQS